MPDPFAWGCSCGETRYADAAPARYMANCHCRNGQQATGSAYFPAAVVRVGDFKLEKDDPAWFERTAHRGRGMPEKR